MTKNEIKNKVFENERDCYNSESVSFINCSVEGILDGESFCKESSDIFVDNCGFKLRYPFWHNDNLEINESVFYDTCRAPLWYSSNISFNNVEMNSPKSIRESTNIKISNSKLYSEELLWFCNSIAIENSETKSDYVALRCDNINANNLKHTGKYSFQYITNSTFKNCYFDTKDSFWHAKDVTIEDSVINGEYLAWYCENLTFINCKIKGTQPFCYCKNLKLINCEMIDCDLSFEKSDVNATLIGKVESIKNPANGLIQVESVGQIIIDDEKSNGKIIVKKNREV